MSYTSELASPPPTPRFSGPHTLEEISIIQAEWALLKPKLDGILRDKGQAENIRWATSGTALQIPETMPFVDVIAVANWALDEATRRHLESVMEATLDSELSKRTFMVYRDEKPLASLGTTAGQRGH